MSVPQNLNEVVKSCFKKHGVGNLCCLNCFRDFVLAQARELNEKLGSALDNVEIAKRAKLDDDIDLWLAVALKYRYARDVLLKLIQAKIEDLK